MIKSRMRLVNHVESIGEMINAFKIFIGKPEGKRPLRRHGHRWKDNITMDLRKPGWLGVDWINMAQDKSWWLALVNTVINLLVL
jgi:hypothetical protein